MKQQFEAIFEVPPILSNGREATTYLKPKSMDAQNMNLFCTQEKQR
jgi:hypothetical protein